MDTVRLRVIGITYTQIENGMYAMVLEDEESSLRIPIIIGYTEAQAIESAMQKTPTKRPLPQDTTATLLRAFDIELESVIIRLNEDGIFTADLNLTGHSQMHTIDARSSDAIALAIRMGAPILTSRELIEKSGLPKDQIDARITSNKREYPAPHSIAEQTGPENKTADIGSGISHESTEDAEEDNPLRNISEPTLMRMMERAVNQENYEKAARIKDELQRRSAVL